MNLPLIFSNCLSFFIEALENPSRVVKTVFRPDCPVWFTATENSAQILLWRELALCSQPGYISYTIYKSLHWAKGVCASQLLGLLLGCYVHKHSHTHCHKLSTWATLDKAKKRDFCTSQSLYSAKLLCELESAFSTIFHIILQPHPFVFSQTISWDLYSMG